MLVMSELVTAVEPISSIPTQYTERHVTYKVWDGQLTEGTEKVRATTTDVTVYDHDGHVTTNSKFIQVSTTHESFCTKWLPLDEKVKLQVDERSRRWIQAPQRCV